MGLIQREVQCNLHPINWEILMIKDLNHKLNQRVIKGYLIYKLEKVIKKITN